MMIEKEILDYLQFGKMVTAIEAEFSHIAIGDAHTNIQLLEQFPFGKISEDTNQLRTDAFCELYGMIGSAFHSACQLIINKDEPIILEAIGDCLSKLNQVISENSIYIRRGLMNDEFRNEYIAALNKLQNAGKQNMIEQLVKFKKLLFI